jgi:3-isopropylmalate/(R)-2-methylmalate dehydratase large subunit
MALTLQQKIWDLHAVLPSMPEDDTLLYVDRNFVHEESAWAFDVLKLKGGKISFPERHFAFIDHYAPTIRDKENLSVVDREAQGMISNLAANARDNGLSFFGLDHPGQGIMHVVAPERGLTLPGFIVTGSDSHVCTNGAFGALAFGISQSEIAQVLWTQSLWRQTPKSMKIEIRGALGPLISAKDIALAVIASIGSNGATGYLPEFCGDCVETMTMEQRMTLCNMSIEMGASTGVIAPDDITYDYLAACSPGISGSLLDEATGFWRTLVSDKDALFDGQVLLNASEVSPMVTWGTMLEDVCGIDSCIPDPKQAGDAERQSRMEKALNYMGLEQGTPINGIPIDLVFIGSCTNSRIEDLRVAANIIKGRTAAVKTIVSPGSMKVKRQAEAEGLDQVFTDAGFEWRSSGCSMCVGSNGDVVGPGMRCASTSPRNFDGRQGVGARTHVMSPAMAAAAAVAGRITDVRDLVC